MNCPVLLVHGFGSSFRHGWVRHGWPDLLADETRSVIGVNLLGHGDSERPHDPAAYADVGDCIRLACAGHLRIDAVGFSSGAAILLELAGISPGLFRRLVLIGVGDGIFEPRDPNALARAVLGETRAEGELKVLRRLALSEGNDPQALAAFLRRPKVVLGENALAGLTIPVLVITGGRDPAGEAPRLCAALPCASHLHLEECDHFGLPSNSRAIEAALEFLRDV